MWRPLPAVVGCALSEVSPNLLRYRAHEKLMRAFLNDVYEGRVRIDPNRAARPAKPRSSTTNAEERARGEARRPGVDVAVS